MSYRVPFGDLRINVDSRKNLDRCLAKNWVSQGDMVKRFETGVAAEFGWKHAIATSSGTDAGQVVMRAVAELTGKTEVLTPALAFVATANCILAAGLAPGFVDIKLDTLNLDEELVWQRLCNQTAAVQYVATMGKVKGFDRIAAEARRRGLMVIFDGCEAHGARLNGQEAAHYADAAIYSFYTAHLVVCGEGGMICTNDDNLAAICRSALNHGRPSGTNAFEFIRVGFNSKMNDMEAAIGLGELRRFAENFVYRRWIRSLLLEGLRPLPQVVVFPDGEGEVISPHAFPVLFPELGRTQAMDCLNGAGIETKTLFGSLPTQHRAFSKMGYRLGVFPVAELVGATGVHFGCNQYMTREDVEYIVETITRFVRF